MSFDHRFTLFDADKRRKDRAYKVAPLWENAALKHHGRRWHEVTFFLFNPNLYNLLDPWWRRCNRLLIVDWIDLWEDWDCWLTPFEAKLQVQLSSWYDTSTLVVPLFPISLDPRKILRAQAVWHQVAGSSFSAAITMECGSCKSACKDDKRYFPSLRVFSVIFTHGFWLILYLSEDLMRMILTHQVCNNVLLESHTN